MTNDEAEGAKVDRQAWKMLDKCVQWEAAFKQIRLAARKNAEFCVHCDSIVKLCEELLK